MDNQSVLARDIIPFTGENSSSAVFATTVSISEPANLETLPPEVLTGAEDGRNDVLPEDAMPTSEKQLNVQLANAEIDCKISSQEKDCRNHASPREFVLKECAPEGKVSVELCDAEDESKLQEVATTDIIHSSSRAADIRNVVSAGDVLKKSTTDEQVSDELQNVEAESSLRQLAISAVISSPSPDEDDKVVILAKSKAEEETHVDLVAVEMQRLVKKSDDNVSSPSHPTRVESSSIHVDLDEYVNQENSEFYQQKPDDHLKQNCEPEVKYNLLNPAEDLLVEKAVFIHTQSEPVLRQETRHKTDMVQVREGSSSNGHTSRGKQVSKGSDGESEVAIQEGNSENKLRKATNAWLPTHKQRCVVQDSEHVKTENLRRKILAILNKMTPQKFRKLVEQINNLSIDTEERLNGACDIIYEKAIMDTRYSIVYANLCKCLALKKVPLQDKKTECVNFRKLLLNKCQKEFEGYIKKRVDKNKSLKDIESAETFQVEKKMEEYHDMEKKARRRMLGNIRFIGELFKLNMLTEGIMHTCIIRLLTEKNEHSLECLACLLTIIGKDLDFGIYKVRNTRCDMIVYFKHISEIIDKRQTSSRVRSLLQNVLELREKKWVSQKDKNALHTVHQIHLEAKQQGQVFPPLFQKSSASHFLEREGRKFIVSEGFTAGGRRSTASKSSPHINLKLKLLKLLEEDIRLDSDGHYASDGIGWLGTCSRNTNLQHSDRELHSEHEVEVFGECVTELLKEVSENDRKKCVGDLLKVLNGYACGSTVKVRFQ